MLHRRHHLLSSRPEPCRSQPGDGNCSDHPTQRTPEIVCRYDAQSVASFHGATMLVSIVPAWVLIETSRTGLVEAEWIAVRKE